MSWRLRTIQPTDTYAITTSNHATPCFPFLISATLACVALLPLPFAAMTMEPPAAALSKQAPQFIFVQTADRRQVDGQALSLVNASPQNISFSDRPNRVTGHLSVTESLKK